MIESLQEQSRPARIVSTGRLLAVACFAALGFLVLRITVLDPLFNRTDLSPLEDLRVVQRGGAPVVGLPIEVNAGEIGDRWKLAGVVREDGTVAWDGLGEGLLSGQHTLFRPRGLFRRRQDFAPLRLHSSPSSTLTLPRGRLRRVVFEPALPSGFIIWVNSMKGHHRSFKQSPSTREPFWVEDGIDFEVSCAYVLEPGNFHVRPFAFPANENLAEAEDAPISWLRPDCFGIPVVLDIPSLHLEGRRRILRAQVFSEDGEPISSCANVEGHAGPNHDDRLAVRFVFPELAGVSLDRSYLVVWAFENGLMTRAGRTPENTLGAFRDTYPEIALGPAESVVAGRFVDEYGAPVPDVLVELMSPRSLDSVEPISMMAPARTDADGHFSVKGLRLRPRYRLRAWAPSYRRWDGLVEAGAQLREFVLERR